MAVQVAGARRVRALYPILCAGMVLADAIARRVCALYVLLRAGMALVDAVTCRACAFYALLRAGMAIADAVARRACALYALLCAQAWRLLTPSRAGYALCMPSCTQRQGACGRRCLPGTHFVCTIVHKGRALAADGARRECALYALLCAQAWRLLTPSRAGHVLCMPSCAQPWRLRTLLLVGYALCPPSCAQA